MVGLCGMPPQDIEALWRALPREVQAAIRLDEMTPAELASAENLDLLAIAPEVSLEQCSMLPSCQILLLPGSAGALLRCCKASSVISYGSSSKDSLTLSSLEVGHLSLSIQRELPTLTGNIIERQELLFPLADSKKAPWLLFRVGLLLVLGAFSEDLPAALEICASKR